MVLTGRDRVSSGISRAERSGFRLAQMVGLRATRFLALPCPSRAVAGQMGQKTGRRSFGNPLGAVFASFMSKIRACKNQLLLPAP